MDPEHPEPTPPLTVDFPAPLDLRDSNDIETLDGEAVPLRPLHEAFVAEYLIDLNVKAAAARVGISSGYELMQRPDVQQAIERAKAQRLARVGMTQDTVLHEMSLLSHSRINHYVIDDNGEIQLAPGAPNGALAAVQSVKRKTRIFRDKEGNETAREYDVEIKLWDKPGTLKLMGRHVGLFPDRMEHTGKGGGPIETVARIERIIISASSGGD